jgi:hypothetical protein
LGDFLCQSSLNHPREYISQLSVFLKADNSAGDDQAAPASAAEPADAAVPKPAEAAKTTVDGFPPTFTEKPRIVPNETGTLVTMKFKVRLDIQKASLFR